MAHRYLPHTGDLRAAVSGADAPSLYQSAADLVREIVAGSSPVAPREWRRFDADGEDEAERFFRFVRELVYLYDSEGFLPARVETAASAWSVAGERFDPLRHRSERQVKAVTRHGYRFERSPDGLRAELVFDL